MGNRGLFVCFNVTLIFIAVVSLSVPQDGRDVPYRGPPGTDSTVRGNMGENATLTPGNQAVF